MKLVTHPRIVASTGARGMPKIANCAALTIRRECLKLTTTYNIIHGHSHFPSGVFAHSNFPYSSNRSLNFTRPFAHTIHSFVPSVIGLWNNLPPSLKAMPSISTFKRSLLYHFHHVGTCQTLADCYIMLPLSIL